MMKTKILAAFAAVAIVTAGCVSTVTGTSTAAVPFTKDSVEGRYERTVDQVYQASVAVMQANGVIVTEYIPHDTTNTVRSLYGKVNQKNVWMRVAAVDPKITAVTVQSRSKMGGSDVDLAHELEKEIALQLVAR
jgi:PBP1b-binding outer membrane lipoprotein LpoB